jgi:hypothetical protein
MKFVDRVKKNTMRYLDLISSCMDDMMPESQVAFDPFEE